MSTRREVDYMEEWKPVIVDRENKINGVNNNRYAKSSTRM